MQQEEKFIVSEPYIKFRQLHGQLSRRLIGILIALVFVFDLMCIYAQEFMSRAVIGGVITTGLVLAFVIVTVIVGGSLYYIRRVNSAYIKLRESINA